jgi:hypothetical protein
MRPHIYYYYYYSFGNAPLFRRLTDESEERAVFLGVTHTSTMQPPAKVCTVWCVQHSVPHCQKFFTAPRLGNGLLLLHLIIAVDFTGHGNFDL